MNVLIVGGTDAARERVARRIHDESAVRLGPFVAAHAARDGATLARAFRGWATVADDPAANPLRAAERGTLFVDRVEALGRDLQRLLLLLVRTQRLTPEPGARTAWVGRLVVGTPIQLVDAARAGAFHEDLLDHLDKLRIDLAAGREDARW